MLLAALAVEIWLSIAGGATAARVLAAGGLIPARLTGLAGPGDIGLPPAATLITSLFLHAGWFHLGANALFLVVIGRFVEPALGAGRFVVVFLLAGVAGGIAQTLADPASLDPVIGASGAISGVFAVYLMRFAARSRAPARAFGLDWPADLAAALRFTLAWGVLQLLTAYAGLGIAVWAHLGGFVAGLPFGVARWRR